MRPFSSLGVKPFLFASTSDLSDLKTIFIKLSREHHPDLFVGAGDDLRREHEAKLSQINTDYALIKDPIGLISYVVGLNQTKTASAPPPDLASEYFELQELWEEQGIEAPVSKMQGKNLLDQARMTAKKASNEIFELAQQFPFRGSGEAQAPWNDDYLQNFKLPLNELRYAERLLNDIKSKYPQLES